MIGKGEADHLSENYKEVELNGFWPFSALNKIFEFIMKCERSIKY